MPRAAASSPAAAVRGAAGGGWLHWLIPLVATGVAYFGTGLAALALAIPPSFASPLYPAAGVALASVLVYGWRMLGGVALGAVGVNLALNGTRGLHDGAAVFVPIVVACAAALQAGAGAAIVRRFVRAPLTLTLPRDIAAFFACCAASSVIGASVSILALKAALLVPAAKLASEWGTWWIGDLFGLLVWTPIVLTLIGSPRSEWSPRRLSVGLTMTLVTVFLGFAIFQAARWNEQRLRDAFAHDASSASLILSTQLDEPLRALEALRGVFDLGQRLSAAEMRRATSSWLGLSGVSAMGWSERVRHEDVAAFEARARAEGFAGYRVFNRAADAAGSSGSDANEAGTIAGDADVLAVRLIEPLAGNASALGVNALSVPAARAADPARRRQRPADRFLAVSPDAGSDRRPAQRRRRLPGDLRQPGGECGQPPRRPARRRLRDALRRGADRRKRRQDAGVPEGLHRRRRPAIGAAPARRAGRVRGRCAAARAAALSALRRPPMGRARQRRPRRHPGRLEPQPLDALGDRPAVGGDARRVAAHHDRPDSPHRDRGARADRGAARRGERAAGGGDRAASERAALSQHPRQRADRRRLHRPRRPRHPGQSALLRADRLRRARADDARPGCADAGRGPCPRRRDDGAARRRRDPDVPAPQALPDPCRRRRLGALDGLAAARRGQRAVADRRRRRGHHRAPAPRGGRARPRGGRGLEPRQERLPLAHEPRAAHAAERHARLRPAARDRPAQSADDDAAAVGGADPAGRLAPARDDQRRPRPVANRLRQPAPADDDARARRAGRGDDGARRQRRRAARHPHQPRARAGRVGRSSATRRGSSRSSPISSATRSSTTSTTAASMSPAASPRPTSSRFRSPTPAWG